MNVSLFWVLYAIGAVWFSLTMLVNSKVKPRDYISFKMLPLEAMIMIATVGELGFAGLWLWGALKEQSILHWWMGALPVGMILLTWGSIGYHFTRATVEEKLKYKKEKRWITPLVEEWIEENKNFEIEHYHWASMGDHGLRLYLWAKVDSENEKTIDWAKEANKLKEKFKTKALILEIRGGEKGRLYPPVTTHRQHA